MEISQVRNRNENKVCIGLEEKSTYAHECSMLVFNDIPALLPLSIRYVDEKLYVEYSPSGTVTLLEYFKDKRLDMSGLEELVDTLYKTQEQLRDYMLSGDGLILNPEYIFVETENNTLRFCYAPGIRESVEENIKPLLHFLLDHVDYTDQKAVALAYGLFQLKDCSGDIITAFKVYAQKESRRTQIKYDVAAENDWKASRCAEEPPSQKGFFYKLFHRKSKKDLILGESRQENI